MSGASVLRLGVALGLVGALVYGLWYANKKGMFRSGPDLSNTHWSIEGQGLNGLNMTFNTAKPGGNLAMTWGRSMQITGTYRQSLVKFVVDGQVTSLTFEGVVNRAGTIIEGD